LKLQTGDVILVKYTGKFTPIADSIEWFSNGDVSHCFMYLEDQKILNISWSRGTHLGKINKYQRKNVEMTVRRYNPLTPRQTTTLKVISYMEVGKQYDYFAIFGGLVRGLVRKLNFKFATRWKYFDTPASQTCSETIAKLYKTVGITLVPVVNESLVTPHDLLTSDVLTTVS